MKKVYYSFLFSLSLVVLFAACKGSDETKEEVTAETTEEVMEKKPVADQVEMIPIALNNGEKWKADALTTRGIGDIKGVLQEINVTNTEEDYQVFIENLQSTIEQTYKSSELTGEAKEQFRKFMKNVDQVSNHLKSSDTFIRQDAYEEMFKVLDSYNEYFE